MPAQHCSKYERYNGECNVFVLVSRDSLAGKTEKKNLTITRMLSAMWEAVSITSDYVTVNISAVSVFP